MTEKIHRIIADVRQRVNAFFCLAFKRNLIKDNERGIAELEDTCTTADDFVVQIANLSTLVDDIDREALLPFVGKKHENPKSISLLEEFLGEKNLKKRDIIKNLRIIKRIRNTVFPIHRATPEFLEIMSDIGFKPPFDWQPIWRRCLDMYHNSLVELSDSLDAYNSKFEYSKVEQPVNKSEKRKDIIYLNDYLYRYRILIPTKSESDERTLVDYITAALIAYEKDLKSINYALRKYVVPLRHKFRIHAEDPYFAIRRRYVNNEQLGLCKIMVSRDDVGIIDNVEFDRYFRYIWVAFAAYSIGVQPDWIIKGYDPDYISGRRSAR